MLNKVNELQLHELTGVSRETVRKRVDGLPFELGPRRAKFYQSLEAIRRVLQLDSDGITPAEASKRLNIAREAQIQLEMEVTRKERVRIEEVKAAWQETHSNVAGILRGYRKQIGEQCLEDLFSELRHPRNAPDPPTD